MIRLVAVLTLALALAAPGLAQPPANAPPPLIREGAAARVSDHVWVIPDFDVGGVPNVGIIVGAKATLVIDTGLGRKNGETVLREVAKLSRNKTLYLVVTHTHPEHDLGAVAFPPETIFVRSNAQVREIASGAAQRVVDRFHQNPVMAGLMEGSPFRTANVTFEREHSIDLGGVTARLVSLGPAHTEGDTAIYIAPDKVLFSGDLAMSGTPGLTSPASSLTVWLASLDALDRFGATRVVPSHGRMGDGAFMAGYRAFFTEVRRQAAKAKAEGKTADQTVEALTPGLLSFYSGRGRVADTVRIAWNEAK